MRYIEKEKKFANFMLKTPKRIARIPITINIPVNGTINRFVINAIKEIVL